MLYRLKLDMETIENSKQNEVVDCPNHRDKICILRRLQKIKDSSGLIKSLKSETDDVVFRAVRTFQSDPH